MSRPLTVMLVAAEASGDDRGAGLARALKARLGEGVRFVGVGGAAMATEGVQSPFDIGDISILGLWEGLLAYPKIVRRADETAAIAARKPLRRSSAPRFPSGPATNAMRRWPSATRSATARATPPAWSAVTQEIARRPW